MRKVYHVEKLEGEHLVSLSFVWMIKGDKLVLVDVMKSLAGQ